MFCCTSVLYIFTTLRILFAYTYVFHFLVLFADTGLFHYVFHCFFQFRASPLVPWLGWIILKFRGFCRQTFAHFLQLALAHFLNVVCFFNTILIFLWHINRFNVRQEKSTKLLFYMDRLMRMMRPVSNITVVSNLQAAWLFICFNSAFFGKHWSKSEVTFWPLFFLLHQWGCWGLAQC